MAAELGIEEGMKLHAKYADGEYYPAVVAAVSSAKTRAKKPVKVTYNGFPDAVWVPISALKSKKLGLKPDDKPEPKAKAKAKVKAKAKAKAKTEPEKKRDPVKFTYFPVWAKGPSIALALDLSGIAWVGEVPENWSEMKPSTPFKELPVLELPGTGYIGHEAAILNYIGRRSKKMDGFTMADFLVSQQLMQEAEDIYKKLGQIKNKMISEEDAAAFWVSTDAAKHNKDFGINVFLDLLDKFYTKCNAGEGKYTKSGVTVGECKLFTMLHACKMCKDDVMDEYAGVKAFYDRFLKLEKTQAVIDGTGTMPCKFNQYFGK